jgi:hypothetical protein
MSLVLGLTSIKKKVKKKQTLLKSTTNYINIKLGEFQKYLTRQSNKTWPAKKQKIKRAAGKKKHKRRHPAHWGTNNTRPIRCKKIGPQKREQQHKGP